VQKLEYKYKSAVSHIVYVIPKSNPLIGNVPIIIVILLFIDPFLGILVAMVFISEVKLRRPV